MKAWKVTVNRQSCVISNFEHQLDYVQTYEQGTDVEADEGTLGIFCFDTEKNAKQFAYKMQENFDLTDPVTPFKIMKVKSAENLPKSSGPRIRAAINTVKIKVNIV